MMIMQYYHHSPSNKSFRSKQEVVQFVLTETCPPKPNTARKTPDTSRKTPKTSRKTPSTCINIRKNVEDVESEQVVAAVENEHVVECVVSEHLVQAVIISYLAEVAVSNHLDELGAGWKTTSTGCDSHDTSGKRRKKVEAKIREHPFDVTVSKHLVETTVSDLVDGGVSEHSVKAIVNKHVAETIVSNQLVEANQVCHV